ncbi:MAG TPA: hypothetical protein DEB06_09880 [Phycisphaerales bacterium]|nr:hypothetical protein [Phycisphaerales bacterium]
MLTLSRRTAIPLPAILAGAVGLARVARADDPPFIPNQVVVELVPGALLADFNARYASVTIESIPGRPIHLLLVPAALDAPAFLALIAGDPDLVVAELNSIAEDINPEPGTQSIFLPRTGPAMLAQESIDIIDAPEARSASSGAGVLVAVIDSGADANHAFLAGALAPGGIDLVGDGAGTSDAPDLIDNDNDGLIDEAVGHGTIVAGIIRLVAPDALILPIRVMDSDGGSTIFRLTSAIYRAADAGADIINISLGTTADPVLLREAVAYATASGALVVASAGNENTESPLRSPASLSLDGALGVAATTSTDVKAEFSNYGTPIALSAPGVGVIGPTPGGGYGEAQGTSFAAPLVSASAALVRSVAPLLPPDELRVRLASTAAPIDALNPGFEGRLGAGRVNAARALGLNAPPLAQSADLNNDARVDADDLYLWHLSPRDLNSDGAADAADAAQLKVWLQSR